MLVFCISFFVYRVPGSCPGSRVLVRAVRVVVPAARTLFSQINIKLYIILWRREYRINTVEKLASSFRPLIVRPLDEIPRRSASGAPPRRPHPPLPYPFRTPTPIRTEEAESPQCRPHLVANHAPQAASASDRDRRAEARV